MQATLPTQQRLRNHTGSKPRHHQTGFSTTCKNSGFNRISIGAQSFNPDELKLLERIHSGDEIDTTVHAAREAGFGNLSLDLMFALPDQSLETWQQNLNRALDLQPDHISCYNLMIEPNTSFKTSTIQATW